MLSTCIYRKMAISRLWRTLHRPRVWLTVEPILLLYMFSNFLSYSSLQEFLEYLICSHTSNCTLSSISSSLNTCDVLVSEVDQQVQADTSHWLLYLNLAAGIPSILVSLLYGSLSDRLGRKLFIVLPAIGSAFNAAVVLQLLYLRETLPIAFLLFGSLVVGFFGNFSVINFAVYSYASDISACSKRTRQIGILESMTYIGGTVSLLLGGVWIKTSQSYSPPFWCIVACNIMIVIYVIVGLPESWSVAQRNSDAVNVQVDYYRDVGMKALCKSIGKNIYDYFALLLTNWRMAMLMMIFFVIEINFLGITDVVILYTIGKPLCWASDFIGYFLALKLFFNGISLLVILPILLAIGLSDIVILSLGLISGSSALVIMGLSTHTWMMFLGENLAKQQWFVHYAFYDIMFVNSTHIWYGERLCSTMHPLNAFQGSRQGETRWANYFYKI